MVDTFYKAYERRVCRAFGGNRRGADYGGKDGGKNDCKCVGFSVEIKCWSKPTFKAIEEDIRKAGERKQVKSDIPVSVMKRKGDPDANAIVSISYVVFINEILPLLKEKKILQQLGFD